MERWYLPAWIPLVVPHPVAPTLRGDCTIRGSSGRPAGALGGEVKIPGAAIPRPRTLTHPCSKAARGRARVNRSCEGSERSTVVW